MPVIPNTLPNAGGFKVALAQWFTEQAALAKGLNVLTRKGPELLTLIAAQVHSLPEESQTLRSLHYIRSRMPKPRGTEGLFVPTSRQARSVGNIGQTAEELTPEEILAELIAVGIEDLSTAVAQEQAAIAKQQADERIRVAEEDRDVKVSTAHDARDEALRKFHASEAEITDLRKQVEHLRAALEGKPEGETKAAKPKAKAAA